MGECAMLSCMFLASYILHRIIGLDSFLTVTGSMMVNHFAIFSFFIFLHMISGVCV